MAVETWLPQKVLNTCRIYLFLLCNFTHFRLISKIFKLYNNMEKNYLHHLFRKDPDSKTQGYFLYVVCQLNKTTLDMHFGNSWYFMFSPISFGLWIQTYYLHYINHEVEREKETFDISLFFLIQKIIYGILWPLNMIPETYSSFQRPWYLQVSFEVKTFTIGS